ncbi:hypothetical protein FO519_002383 [Halicephalobus sp. NKZ332]|nr:hypothetical protein FO519_002383 [Halicephalobus sp. NKZ332]
MDFGTALSTLIKPQHQFPDPAALLALANLFQKYPLANYGLPNYAHSLIQPRQQGGLPPLDIAGLIAAATGQEPESKLVASLASALQNQQASTPITSSSISLSQLPIPIPAQPSSPTQSSASASSLSSSGSLTTQNSPNPARSNGTTTPVFGAGYKRKLNGTPTRKPPAPIPDEKKDEAYYERRKKNNDAAKRSRDARRMKEEQTATKASFLEQENIQLRTQLELLKSEIAKLQMLLISKTTNGFQNLSNIKDEINEESRSSEENNFESTGTALTA